MDQCSICYEDISANKNRVHLNCKHVFHFECIQKVNNGKCPLCRDNFGPSDSFMDILHQLDKSRNVFAGDDGDVINSNFELDEQRIQNSYSTFEKAFHMIKNSQDKVEQKILLDYLKNIKYVILAFEACGKIPSQEIKQYDKKYNKLMTNYLLWGYCNQII
jgi:hypothetical protein